MKATVELASASWEEDPAAIESAQKINEEFRIWKKNSAYLYDMLVIHATEWPSLTSDWLPNPVVDVDRQESVFSIILGTHTSEDVGNKLLLATVTLPRKDATVDQTGARDGKLEKKFLIP